MLDYTIAAYNKIKEDFNKLLYYSTICTQLLYMAYLIYALITGTGIFIANMILFVVAGAYFAFFLYATANNLKKPVKKTVKRLFTRCKQLVKLFTLGVMVYGICQTAANARPVSVLITALMIIGFVLQILFELVAWFLTNRINLFIEGLKADYETITKPVKTVGNFFKKMAGKEIEEAPEPTKQRIILDQRVAEARAERQEKKLTEKWTKQEEKKRVKALKKQAKAAKKAEKRGVIEEEIAVAEDK